MISVSSAQSTSPGVVLIAADSVANFQNFPIEIHIPKELRNETIDIVFSTNCSSLRLYPLDGFSSKSVYNYLGESLLHLNASIRFSTKSTDQLPGVCSVRAVLRGPGGKFWDAHKNITIQPATANYKIKEFEWEYFTDNKTDFRGYIKFSHFNRTPDCSVISERTLGIKRYDVELQFGSEDFYEAIAINNISLKDHMAAKTNQYKGTFLAKNDELKQTDFQVKELSITGFREAYELDMSVATRGISEYYGCYDQNYRIYGITDEGHSVILFGKFYGRLRTIDDVKKMFESNRQDMKDFLKNLKVEGIKLDKYHAPTIIVQEEEEEEDIARKEFSISFNRRDSSTIWNRGRLSTNNEDDSILANVRIKGEAFDENGKKLKKISSDELFLGVRLIARIESNQSQIGFDGILSPQINRSLSSSLESLDIRGIGPRIYEGFYRPSEKFIVHLEYNGEKVSEEITYTVNVKDASPRVILNNPSIEVQDGNKRMISFKIEDDDRSRLRCSLMIPTGYAHKAGIPTAYMTYNGKETTLVETDCKHGDTIKVMFHAPNLGNFNLNNELDALSMWKMQQDTMKSLATDLIGFGVEKRLNYLKHKSSTLHGLSRIDEYLGSVPDADLLKRMQQADSALNALESSNNIAVNSQNFIKLTQMAKNVNTSQALGAQAVGSGEQGWLEWGADWGLVGIDIAQSTVGAIAMAPGKIPVVGPLGAKIGAGFSLTFNLMTNVWKGNFEYLSKVEKINRAKDMQFPIPVIITVEDEDGFTTKEIQNVMVVYNWLD